VDSVSDASQVSCGGWGVKVGMSDDNQEMCQALWTETRERGCVLVVCWRRVLLEVVLLVYLWKQAGLVMPGRVAFRRLLGHCSSKPLPHAFVLALLHSSPLPIPITGIQPSP